MVYTISVDLDLARQAESVFQAQGLNLAEAVTAFLRETVEPDLFTEEELTAAYDRGMEQVRAGKVHVTTLEELEQMANGKTDFHG